jgi:hypothetical protein
MMSRKRVMMRTLVRKERMVGRRMNSWGEGVTQWMVS